MIVAACAAALMGAIFNVLMLERPTIPGIAMDMALFACMGVLLHAALS